MEKQIMPAFHYEDTTAIKYYIKSLDEFDRFETIELNTFVNMLEISIFSKERQIVREVFSTSLRQQGFIFFDDEFEINVESISAAVEIQSRLSELKEIKSSDISVNDRFVTVHSSNDHVSYEIRIFNRVSDPDFEIFVKATFSDQIDGIYCERVYCTDGYLVDFDRFEELICKFDELDAVRTSK